MDTTDNKLTAEEKRKLFENYEKAEEAHEKAEQAVQLAKEERSKAVEAIFLASGKGPFGWKGDELTIVERKGNYFFRGRRKKRVVEEIG